MTRYSDVREGTGKLIARDTLFPRSDNPLVS